MLPAPAHLGPNRSSVRYHRCTTVHREHETRTKLGVTCTVSQKFQRYAGSHTTENGYTGRTNASIFIIQGQCFTLERCLTDILTINAFCRRRKVRVRPTEVSSPCRRCHGSSDRKDTSS